MTTTAVPATTSDSHSIRRSLRPGSFVLPVLAASCVTVMLLALSSLLARPAGASEAGTPVAVSPAMVCEMGDGVVTTTDTGQMIPPAVCEVRVGDPVVVAATDDGAADGTSASSYGGAVPDEQRNWEDIPTPISQTPIEHSTVVSSSPLGGFGLRPVIGAVLIIASIVIRLAGRLLWGRRRRGLRF